MHFHDLPKPFGTFGIVCVLPLLLAGESIEISRSSVDGGGVMKSVTGEFELSATIGQPDAGTIVGGDFELAGGFWYAVPGGDCGEDGIVDQSDHASLINCIVGPAGGIVVGCACLETNNDGNIDLADYANMQNARVSN